MLDGSRTGARGPSKRFGDLLTLLLVWGSTVLAQPFTLDNGSNLDLGGNKDGGLSWADFNEDGCLDLLVNTETNSNCDGDGGANACGSRIFLQDTSGTSGAANFTCDGTWDDVTTCLAPLLASARTNSDSNERSAVWGDLDGDGLLDLIVNTAGNATTIEDQAVEIYLNNGSGETINGTNGSTGCTGTGFNGGVAWTQFGGTGTDCVVQGGGDPDEDETVCASAGDTPSITVDGRAAGSTTSPLGALQHVRVIGGSEPLNAEMVAIVDYDDDGDLDVFIDNHDDGLAVLENTGTWTSPGVLSTCNNDGTSPEAVNGTPFICDEAAGMPSDDDSNPDGDYGAVADLDRDGDIDAILRKANANEDLYLSDGVGPRYYDDVDPDVDIDDADNGNKGGNAPCDFDSDGDFDFFWTENGTNNNTSNQIWTQDGSPSDILDDGDGTFTASGEPLASEPGVNFNNDEDPGDDEVDGVACGDWDNDGDMDFILTYNGGDFLFRNDFVENGGILSPPADRLQFTCLMGPDASCDVNTRQSVGCDPDDGDIGCEDGEAVAFGDTDRDGDIDLIINQDDANEYWENNTSTSAPVEVRDNYLMVEARWDLDGTPGGATRAAIGATVLLYDCQGVPLSPIQEVNGGRGHGSQNPAILHFGLEDTDGVGSGTEPEDDLYVVQVEYNAVHTGTDPSLIVRRTVTPSSSTTADGWQLITVTSTDDFNNSCPTPAIIAGLVEERSSNEDSIIVHWTTASEPDTFTLQLFDGKAGKALSSVVPAVTSPQGANYSVPVDAATVPAAYWIKEITVRGKTKWHGPLKATAESLVLMPAGPSAPNTTTADLPAQTPADIELTQRELRPGGIAATTATTAAVSTSALASTSDRLRILVDATGIQALPLSTLMQSTGKSEALLIHQFQQGALRLRLGDLTVPVWVEGGRAFFYGQATTDPLLPHRTYWLEPGTGQTMSVGNGLPSALFADDFETGNINRWGSGSLLPEASLTTHQQHYEEDARGFFNLLSNPDEDVFSWDYLFTSTRPSINLPLTATEVGSGPGSIDLTFKAGEFGETESQIHKVRVSINGTPLGFAEWAGQSNTSRSLAIPDGVWQDGDNDLELALVDLGQGAEFILFEKIDVTFHRSLVAADGAVRLEATRNQPHQFRGFSDPVVFAVDVTDPSLPLWLEVSTSQEQSGDYGFALQAQSGQTIVTRQEAALLEPTIEIAPPAIVDVSAQVAQADYVVIHGPGLEQGAQDLGSLRASQGLKSAVFSTQALYDYYTDGNVDPRAIRSFLHESEPVSGERFVALIGNGHHDYRDWQGFGDNLLPPLLANTNSGLIASDRMYLADPFGGNTAIGRIPVSTPAQLEAYVADVTAFEASANFDDPAILAINDQRSPEGDFHAMQQQLLAASSGPWDSIDAEELDLVKARSDVLDHLNTNAHDLVSYGGHGGFDRFAADGLLMSTDVAALSNNDPLMLAMTCNAARFDIAGFYSLGQNWIREPGGGVAFFSSVELSDNPLVPSFGGAIYSGIFSTQNQRLGSVLIEAWRELDSAGEMELVYQLLGDPALRLRP